MVLVKKGPVKQQYISGLIPPPPRPMERPKSPAGLGLNRFHSLKASAHDFG